MWFHLTIEQAVYFSVSDPNTGWWYTNPSEKVWSVGFIIPNIWKNKFHVSNHQPEYVLWRTD